MSELSDALGKAAEACRKDKNKMQESNEKIANVTPGHTGYNTLSQRQIERRFGHHAAAIEGPNPNEEIHADLRTAFKKLANTLDQLVPPGRGKSVMFTELETASMWAHKALAVRD